jgi:hypothetical protein
MVSLLALVLCMHYICKILSADIGYVQHFCDKFIQALLSKIDQWTQSGCVIYNFIKSSWELFFYNIAAAACVGLHDHLDL